MMFILDDPRLNDNSEGHQLNRKWKPMCEIIGIIASQDVGVRVSWAAHQLGANNNPD
jgi:hypothetical protein